MTEIAAIGNLSIDVVAGAPPRPGGTVFYAARALAHLAADGRIAAACAARDRDRLLPALETFGLPVTFFESAATTAYTFHYEGDRRIMIQEAVGDPWSAAQSLEAVADARWIDVGVLTRTDFPPETLRALAGDGRRLLVDAQGLVRTPALGPLRTDAEIGDVLRHVTILKLDDEEALTLAGGTDPEGLRSLGVPEVLLTLGSRGSFVVTARASEHVPATQVAGPVDPTGAGDTLAAAYLARRASGAEPVEAARSATETVAAFLGAVEG
jgi:sugar/nucleoside kinase (ribokinase family)